MIAVLRADGARAAGTVQVSSHQLLCWWAGKHSGYGAPPQSCHSTELPVVGSQNVVLLCQPKEGRPAACKASFW